MSLDKPGSDITLELLLPEAALNVGDVFKELWRVTEMNEEWEDEDGEEIEGNKFVLHGPIVGVGKGQQAVLVYALDKDLYIEKDLGFKSGDTIVFSSLNNISFAKVMEMRPSEGWKQLLNPPAVEAAET